MRTTGYIISFILHAVVIAAAMFWVPSSTPTKIDLNMPVYTVELLSLQAPGPADLPPGPPGTPAPKPAPEPQPEPAKPEPQPIPKPVIPEPKPVPVVEPPKPKKPEAKPISETKVADKVKKPEAKKTEPKKPPEPTPEEILAEAMKDVRKDVKAKERADQRKLQNELAALRKEVASSESASGAASGGTGGVGPGGASSLMQVYAAMVEKKIKENWRYPAIGETENVAASVEIVMDSTGKITSSRLVQSSGKPDLDSSALRAVTETEQLPEPPTPQLRRIVINFNPFDRNG